jgi:hypothetical protein
LRVRIVIAVVELYRERLGSNSTVRTILLVTL